MNYGGHAEQLTYLPCLKMADEGSLPPFNADGPQPDIIPAA